MREQLVTPAVHFKFQSLMNYMAFNKTLMPNIVNYVPAHSLTLLSTMITSKLIKAAVAVVVILAFCFMRSSSDEYSNVIIMILYMITPNTAARTQQT